MEKISVIVPVYNTEYYIERCLRSLLNQTYSNIEIVAVDDGSEDKSLQKLQELAKEDSRIAVLHQENRGVSSARNLALQYAGGDYIGFVDSDDYVEPHMYENMLQQMKKNRTEICLCKNIYVGEEKIWDTGIPCGYLKQPEAIHAFLELNYPTSLWAGLFSKRVIGGERLREDIYFYEDLEYQSRLLKKIAGIYVTSAPYYHYINRETSANHCQIGFKKASSMLVPDLVVKSLGQEYSDKYNKLYFSVFYWTMYLGLLKQDIADKEVYRQFQRYVKRNRKKIADYYAQSGQEFGLRFCRLRLGWMSSSSKSYFKTIRKERALKRKWTRILEIS